MTEAEFEHARTLVLAVAFAASVGFGAVAQRTRFCVMGAIADMVVTRDAMRLRMWMLAAGVAVLGFNAMVAAGWVRAADSIYAGSRVLWLSAALGGLLFGFGMVLASGCTSKNLMRLGTGNLKALVVLGMVAFAGFATLRGATAIVRARLLDPVVLQLDRSQDLPTLAAAIAGVDIRAAAGVLGLIVGAALVLLAVLPRATRSRELLLGGAGVGAAVVVVWYASGVLGFVPEDPRTLETTWAGTMTRRMESLSFVSAVAYAADHVAFMSDTSKVATLGMVSAAGVVLGAFLQAWRAGQLRWEGFADTGDLGHHLVGGALMGIGGVTALGCSIGQGLSGVSTLSLGSFVAVAGIVAGGVAATRYQVRRMG